MSYLGHPFLEEFYPFSRGYSQCILSPTDRAVGIPQFNKLQVLIVGGGVEELNPTCTLRNIIVLMEKKG